MQCIEYLEFDPIVFSAKFCTQDSHRTFAVFDLPTGAAHFLGASKGFIADCASGLDIDERKSSAHAMGAAGLSFVPSPSPLEVVATDFLFLLDLLGITRFVLRAFVVPELVFVTVRCGDLQDAYPLVVGKAPM